MPRLSGGQTTTGQQHTTGGNVVVGGVDVKNVLGDSLSDLRTSLQSIVDGGSAQAALPKLEAAKNQIDRISGLTGQLSDDQRKTLAGVITTAMPLLNQLSDRVMAMPGVGDILRPTIGPMKSKLAELSGQSSTTGFGR
jgi:phosphoglycerate-specific signal transduction histidine kinase